MDLGDLKVRISADIASLSAGLQRAQSQVQAAGKKMQAVGAGMQNVGKKMSLAVTAPLLLMGKVGLDELREIEKANAQTGAALAQIGAKSLVSVKGVQALAEALQKKSGIDDQAIQSGANMLLQLGALDTKTKAGAAAFESATKAIVGFADFTGTDATAAGKKFAASLASADQGMLKLPPKVKLGAAAMKDLEAKFKAAGSGAERQQVVADALAAKFANLARLTPTEKIDLFKDKIAGLAAGIVSRLMPAMDPITAVLEKVAAWFDKLSPKTQKWIAIIAVVAAVMGPVLVIMGTMVTALGVLVAAFAAISAPVLLVIAALAAVGIALVLLWRNSETFRDGVKAAFESMSAGVSSVMQSLRETITVWVGWAKALWERYGEGIKAAAQTAWNAISATIKIALAVIKGTVTAALAMLRGDWREAWSAVKEMLSTIWSTMVTLVEKQLASVGRLVGEAWGGIKTATSTAWGKVKDAAINAVEGIGPALKSAASNLPGFLAGAFAAAITKAAEIGGDIKEAVLSAVRGIASAIRSINLPDIDIQMKEFKIPKGPSFSVPSGISWNAAGGIFNGAQIIGVGEAGPEALVPLGSSAKAKSDRSRVMRDAGLAGGSGGGLTQSFNFYGADVNMFAVAQQARFQMLSAGLA